MSLDSAGRNVSLDMTSSTEDEEVDILATSDFLVAVAVAGVSACLLLGSEKMCCPLLGATTFGSVNAKVRLRLVCKTQQDIDKSNNNGSEQ